MEKPEFQVCEVNWMSDTRQDSILEHKFAEVTNEHSKF